MPEKDSRFWRSQIQLAKGENKAYWSAAKKANKAYSKRMSYNIFYSNVNTLSANLLSNFPKPDIQRRFLKKTEDNKLMYNTYLQVAKVAEGSVQYYADVNDIMVEFKRSARNSTKTGAGVDWVVYEPVIGKDENGQEVVSERKLYVESLDYEEFLISSAKKKRGIWWGARRHLLSKADLSDRFNYDAQDEELNYNSENNDDDSTAQKRAEVWEIWDKSEKKRHFILAATTSDEYLESTDDPYKLEQFFPFDPYHFLDSGENIIPIPEYEIYQKKAEELENISKKDDDLQDAIKLVIVTNNQNSDKTAKIKSAQHGDVIGLDLTNPAGAIPDVRSLVNTIPVDGAVALSNYYAAKKADIKQDIFDITGISDLNRGISDPRETATAQKIKGVFGSLRFQDRQKLVQEHIKYIYQIMTEIVCEHWDAETLSKITCTDLPTIEEKQQIIAQIQAAQAQGQQVQLSPQQRDILDQPTWVDVLKIMRSDKLRNYTIDIESTSTVFDDKAAETASINTLIELYLGLVNQAATLQNPDLIKGFIPVMKLAITNIKTGRALSRQIEEAIEGAYNQLLKDKEQQGPNPEMLKMQLEQSKLAADQQDKQSRNQIDLVKVNNESRMIAIKEQEMAAKLNLEQSKLQSDNMNNAGTLQDKQRQTDIRQQEANRKDRELEAETAIATAEILTGVDAPIIAGDVASVA